MADEPTPFNAFIAEWRGSHLDQINRLQIIGQAEALGSELSEAALKAGFRQQLTAAARSYRSMAEYVRHLHDIEVSDPRR